MATKKVKLSTTHSRVQSGDVGGEEETPKEESKEPKAAPKKPKGKTPAPAAEDAPSSRKKKKAKDKDAEDKEPHNPHPDLKSLLAGQAIARMRKDWGDSILMQASDFGIAPIPRIPTGIFNLDYALGGGFPVGRVNVVWGHKSSGKTTSLLRAIAHAQRMCAQCWRFRVECTCKKTRTPTIAYLDVEGTVDIPWAMRLGVDPKQMILSIPETAEMTLDMGEALVREGVDILALDSLAFLTPEKEIESSIVQELPGMQARIIGKGMRKFTSAINARKNETGSGPTLLFTNQVRMKVGVMFGNPELQPGGLAHGFASTTETKFNAGKYELDEVLGKPISAEFSFRVEKNKASSAKMEGEFKMVCMDTEHRKLGEIMNERDVVRWAEKVGLLTGSGSSWDCLGENYRGKSIIEKRMIEELEFREKLSKATMAVLLSQ